MKALLIRLGFCFFILFATKIYAVPQPHYAVSFSASVYSAVMTGTDSAALKITKVTNASLFKTLVTSGSFSGMTASDMDVIYSSGTSIFSVINKTTHAELYSLGVSGTETMASGEIAWGNAAKKIYVLDTAESDISLPNLPTFETYGPLRDTVSQSFENIKSLMLMFNGFNGTNFIQGSIRSTGKVYSY